MNSEFLLDAFDRLGDAPETVQQFRKIVVGLAISGRLNSRIEPIPTATGLLEQIESHKRILAHKGIIRGRGSLVDFSHEGLPKVLANQSNFVRLGEVARIEKGQTSITKSNPGPYPLVVTAEKRRACAHFDFNGSAAIVPLVSSAGHGKASLQRLHYQEGKFALGSILAAVFPRAPELLSARFIFEYLTAFKEELIVSRMIGTANVSLSVGKISDIPVPLIPPSVQRKVDELMGLCDRLEAARADRETVRDRLAAASLACLNAPETVVSRASASDPLANVPGRTSTSADSAPKQGTDGTFIGHAQFVFDFLPTLTARPNQIKALRQTILNLAVRGKLVPQELNDKPALELLKQIAAEKRRLLQARSIKPDRPLPSIRHDEVPFLSPPGWTWVRAQDLSLKISDGVHQKPNYVGSGVPFLTVKNLTEGPGISFRETKFITDVDHAEFIKRTHPEKGDIIITKDGTIGVARIIDTNQVFSIFVSVALMKMVLPAIASFLTLCINSDAIRDTIVPKGAALKHLHLIDLRQLPLPLPPLAEQHRIVAKVDALMELCDKLEASLTAAADTRRRLLDALLAEALAPDEERLREAAE